MADFESQLKNLLKFDNLEKPVQRHLKQVYSALAICMLVAAAGAYVHLFMGFLQGGILSALGSLGLLLALYATPHNPSNVSKRLMYLGGFAFLTGLGLGPLMEMVIRIDPSIVPTAFIGTSAIFICFTVSSLMSSQRYWLYLGGMLFSGMSWLLLLSVANIFMGSQLLFEVNLYLGLAIACGFILYDTQLIVEKRRRGDEDFIWHCVDLFIDFINLFRRIMMLLANRENKKKNSRD